MGEASEKTDYGVIGTIHVGVVAKFRLRKSSPAHRLVRSDKQRDAKLTAKCDVHGAEHDETRLNAVQEGFEHAIWSLRQLVRHQDVCFGSGSDRGRMGKSATEKQHDARNSYSRS